MHGELGFGKQPALLIVDASIGFCDPRSPLACDFSTALPALKQLLIAARQNHLPVIFTTIAYDTSDPDGSIFRRKVPELELLRAGSEWVEIHPDIAPLGDETLLVKKMPSAFFGTDLYETLNSLEVDTLIVAGASTSGCVRATVVDAMQLGLRPIVPIEAVADRNPESHRTALSDIAGRYGDTLTVARLVAKINARSTSSPENH